MAQLVKNLSACNVGGMGLIPGLGRSPGEGKGEISYGLTDKRFALRDDKSPRGLEKRSQQGNVTLHDVKCE